MSNTGRIRIVLEYIHTHAGARGRSISGGHVRLPGIVCTLLVICLSARWATATESNSEPVPVPDGISTHMFVPERSSVLVFGGFTGLHETCPVEGRFKLSVDLRTRTASFLQVDANMMSDNPRVSFKDVGQLFRMTELQGYVIGDTEIGFRETGPVRSGMRSSLNLAFTREGVRLSGALGGSAGPDSTYNEINAFAQYDYGTGAPDDPCRIYTAEQLNAVGADPNLWDKHFRLMADVDLNRYEGNSFNVIGRPDRPFMGVFDGKGRTIRGFSYAPDRPTAYVGLFGYVGGPNAQIRNVQLTDLNVGDGSYGRSNFSNHVGALAGWVREGTICNCHAKDAHVLGEGDVGGLVGGNEGTMINCRFSGFVSGWGNVGGLAGYNNGMITSCYSFSIVGGSGLIGQNGHIRGLAPGTPLSLGQVTDCYAMGYAYDGGLVGANGGVIKRCYSASYVPYEKASWGLVARTDSHATVEASFWDVEASGQATSAGGEGKTTPEMKTAATFLRAGWDFAGESTNGTADIWQICDGEDYPRLWWETAREPKCGSENPQFEPRNPEHAQNPNDGVPVRGR